jgi:ribosomal-protein-alanine acetyltransferase
MKRQPLVIKPQASPSARTIVRGLRGRDVKRVLAINHRAFPADPWTRETAGGRLARSPLGAHRRSAAGLEQFIRLAWLSEVIMLGRLVRHVARHSRGTHYWIVAEAAEKVVGFASLNIVAGRAEIHAIAVAADRAGQGIGNALLSDLVATSLNRGCHDVFLHVRADNHRARNLYERAGFTEMAVRPQFYQPSGADAIVMRLSSLAGIMTDHHDYRPDKEAAEGRQEAQRCCAAPRERADVAASELAQVPQYPGRQN